MDVMKVVRLLEYNIDAVFANVPGRFFTPIIVTPFSVTTVSPATVSSQFPPTSAFMSTITAPDLNDETALLGTVIGAGLPKILAVVTMISASEATPQTVSFTFLSLIHI